MPIIADEYHSWDFDQQSTHTYTNGFHKYPAMMVPQVVEGLLAEYSVPDGVFFDPFCGTGRSLLAAQVAGMRSIGVDINPLAVLIASVKTSPLNPARLDTLFRAISSLLEQTVTPGECDLPSFYHADYWFAPEVLTQLTNVTEAINSILPGNSRYKDFFYVALSETIRDVSWTRNSEFKLYRMDEATRARFKPDVPKIYLSKLTRNMVGMRAYIATYGPRSSPVRIFRSDARYVHRLRRRLPCLSNGVDLIITSPPYGDSSTTVDYGNFSRLSLQWLQQDTQFARRWRFQDWEDIFGINRRCLGGRNANEPIDIPSATFQKQYREISFLDRRRGSEVFRFYADLYLSMMSSSSTLVRNGHLAILVANRRVKGLELLTNTIVIELAEASGLDHIKAITRRICGKRLPRRINTNSKDVKHANTMSTEYILIFEKT